MKKIVPFVALICVGFAAKAQTPGNETSRPDSSSRYQMHRRWGNPDGKDSLHRMHTGRFGQGRDEAGNHFERDRGGMSWGGEMDHSFQHHGPRIHFSPEQRKQMMTINKEYHKKSSDLYKNDNLTLREYKAQLLALEKEKKAKLSGLMTPEQKNQVAMFKKRAAENSQVMAAARMERMKIRLKLTDDQAAAIKTKEQNRRAQMMAIRENDNLLSYQKREQMQSLAAKQKEELKSILTPEQFSQLESMHKRRGEGR